MPKEWRPIDVHTMFPVPLLISRVEGCEELNDALKAELVKRRPKEPSLSASNRYGWHSERDFFERAEPAHAELAAILRAFTEQANAKMAPDLPPGFAMKMEGWVNINPTHAFNAPHDHAGAFWSGTYYADVPVPDDSEDKLSGAIEFIDPRGSLGTSVKIETPMTKPRFTVRPGAGMILLWPAYLKHWVHPNNAAGERVTVSFNAWFAKP